MNRRKFLKTVPALAAIAVSTSSLAEGPTVPGTQAPAATAYPLNPVTVKLRFPLAS